jgi:hypothetical protein
MDDPENPVGTLSVDNAVSGLVDHQVFLLPGAEQFENFQRSIIMNYGIGIGLHDQGRYGNT